MEAVRILGVEAYFKPRSHPGEDAFLISDIHQLCAISSPKKKYRPFPVLPGRPTPAEDCVDFGQDKGM